MIELGSYAKDKITGFEGRVTAVVKFMTGCNRYILTAEKLDKDGKEQDATFDEPRLDVITKKGIVSLNPVLANPKQTTPPG